MKLYDAQKTWKENLENGPRLNTSPKVWFLNKQVNSVLGIAAGPLLDSKWVETASDLGYDILTYKTIRSYKCNGHPVPNIVTLSDGGCTNSFGMPSMDRRFLEEDLRHAVNIANSTKGKALIVSIVGDNMQDFVELAQFVAGCGVDVIELNMSCPNVSNHEGYKNVNVVCDIIGAIRKAIDKCVKLILKVGCFEDVNIMESVFLGAAESGIDAIAGINGIHRQGNELGDDRCSYGVCGPPIFDKACEFVRAGRDIINTYGLPIKLIGVGGVNRVEQIDKLVALGADFVQVASAFIMGRHTLALEYKTHLYS